jgi:hypothetical protein
MFTDILVLITLIFFMHRGASQGFLYSLLGPLSLLVAAAASAYYYNSTKQVIPALCIGIFLPFVLHGLWVLGLRTSGILSGEKQHPTATSSMLGAAVSGIWAMIFLLPVIFIIGITPPVPGLGRVKKDVTISQTFVTIQPLLGKWLQGQTPPSPTGPAPEPALALADDPRMQSVMQDPEIIKAVQEKNYSALLANPKMMEMARDPEFMKKVLSAYSQFMQNGPKPAQ